jgi:CheY-like chemotaxis protein
MLAMIVVIDDHPVTLHAVATLLRLHGHDVRTAPSGHAAIKLLSIIRPNLIILDLCMPDMDGLDVLRGIRGSRVYHDTPVIIFTASSTLATEATRLGAQAAFLKGDVRWPHFLDHIERTAAAG